MAEEARPDGADRTVPKPRPGRPSGKATGNRTNGRPAGLTPSERELWDAYPTGALVDLTGRTVRASVVGRLLLGECPERPGHVPAVRLTGATITGDLDVSGGNVRCEVMLDRCELNRPPNFANTKTRQVRFSSCRMPGFDGGGLLCQGFLSLSRCTITGQVKLPRAQILGGFRLNNAHVVTEDEWAIFTGGLVVEAGTFIRGSVIDGGLRLVGARLNGGLFMENTHIIGGTRDRAAFDGENLIVTDQLECSRSFICDGRFRLRGAEIRGTLSFSRAILRAPKDRLALHASHMKANELILWTREPIVGGVSLSYSRIGVIQDSADTWPDRIFLNGLTYESLRGVPPRERLGWVARDPEFHLEPYEELADWYTRSGREDLAREAQLAKLRGSRHVDPIHTRVPGFLLDWVVGYGYRPWRAAFWFALLLTAGTAVFSLRPPHRLDQPQDVPKFHAFSYTLDLLMPVSLFGQRDHWMPAGWTVWFSYALVACGWILVTALLAGATRILRPS